MEEVYFWSIIAFLKKKKKNLFPEHLKLFSVCDISFKFVTSMFPFLRFFLLSLNYHFIYSPLSSIRVQGVQKGLGSESATAALKKNI